MLSEEDLFRIIKWVKMLEDDDSAARPPRFSFAKIGSGRNRRVYDLENGCILKVAKSLKGVRDISREKELFRAAPPELQKYLATILIGGHGWLIMKKYPPAVPEEFQDRQAVVELIARFASYGIDARDLISRREGFVLWKNLSVNSEGEIIVLDYGNFKWMDTATA